MRRGTITLMLPLCRLNSAEVAQLRAQLQEVATDNTSLHHVAQEHDHLQSALRQRDEALRVREDEASALKERVEELEAQLLEGSGERSGHNPTTARAKWFWDLMKSQRRGSVDG